MVLVTEPTNQPPAPTNQPPAPAPAPGPAPSPAPGYDPPPTSTADPATPRPHRLPRSRAGGLWIVLVVFAVVLLVLMIFILQNGQRSDVYFVGAHGHLPMGVALLLAAIFGVLLIALPTAVRVLQLRYLAARHQNRPAVPQLPNGARKLADK